MAVIRLFEQYTDTKAKFLVDLFWLNGRAKQYMGDPGDRIADWELWLKRLDACSEFLDDPAFLSILKRAKQSFDHLFFVEWAIRCCIRKEQEILKALYLESETWESLGARLYLSSSTISRLRKQAFLRIEQLTKETGGFDDLLEFEI